MATVTERLQLLITASAKGVASEINSVGDASKDAETKTTLLQRAQQKLGIEGMSTGAIMKTALAGGIAVGGAALAKFATDGIEQFSSLTNQVDDLQRVMGGTAEDASRVSSAIRLSGVDAKGAENAFFQLAKRIGEGKDTLSNFGAEVARNKDGTVNMTGTLLSVADAYKAIKDPGERAAFLMENFGRQGKAVGELLERSRDQIKSFFDEAAKNHEIFSQADLDAGKQYRITMAELDQTVQGLKVELGSALVPAVTSGTQALTDTIHAADSATSAFGGLGGTTKALLDNINPLNSATHAVSAGSDLMAGHFADAGKNALEAIPGIGGYAEALFGGEDATNKLGDAQKRAQDAATNLANAQAEHGVKSKEARDAEKELSSAESDLNGMQNNVAASLQHVNDALQTHIEKVYAAQQADIAAVGGKIAVENSTEQVRQKFEDLNNTILGNMETNDQSADANARVSQSQRDLATAVLTTMNAAAQQAVANLGPNATSQDKMTAATDAQSQALLYLEGVFPGLKDQVDTYIGTLGGVPPTKNTTMTVDASQALAAIAEVEGALDRASGRIVDVTINTIHQEFNRP